MRSVCEHLEENWNLYKLSRNNVKLWERKKKDIKYRCNSYCLDFIFLAIVNQLQNDLFSFSRLIYKHMAYGISPNV